MFTSALLTIANIWETTYVSINRWTDKDTVYIHNGVLISHKKKNRAIWDNMNGPSGYYAKWNKPTTNTVISYVESEKQNKWTNKTTDS